MSFDIAEQEVVFMVIETEAHFSSARLRLGNHSDAFEEFRQ